MTSSNEDEDLYLIGRISHCLDRSKLPINRQVLSFFLYHHKILKLTKDETQVQYLVQVVQNHRKEYPSCEKKNYLSTIMETED